MLGGARLAAVLSRRAASKDAALLLYLDARAFRVLQREAQLLRETVHRRPLPLPRTFRLKPQCADAAAPRRDDASNGAAVGAVGVLLIDALDDVRRDANEGAQGGGGLD